jgi:hypothetical protein
MIVSFMGWFNVVFRTFKLFFLQIFTGYAETFKNCCDTLAFGSQLVWLSKKQ